MLKIVYIGDDWVELYDEKDSTATKVSECHSLCVEDVLDYLNVPYTVIYKEEEE